MIFLLFLQIEYQAVNRTMGDSVQQLVLYLTIPSQKLQYVAEDDIFYSRYEIQLTVYDKENNQLTGDYWRRQVTEDTIAIQDSVKLRLPQGSDYFMLKIFDLQGGELLATVQKLLQVRNLGNLFWHINNDTLIFTFTVLNQQGNIDSVVGTIGETKKTTKARNGIYADSIIFDVTGLPIDQYMLNIALYSAFGKIDESAIPVKISRPFYLDEETWSLKVDQLQYIASPAEKNILNNAEVAERDSLWLEFWKTLDPTPNTAYNEKEIEYYERIAYAEEHFSSGDRGWRSDRARIFVQYGPPDEMQSYPYELDSFPYEIWLYYKSNLRFVFVDRYGFGQYILLNPGGLGI
ncbi:MAG: GWxTD domain-containing protein [bacterium]